MKGGKGNRRRVAVIGGGAGGLAAAAAAARLGACTLILEKNDRVGKKLLRTGNGRCNLTNRRLSPAGYNHSEFVSHTLHRFDCGGLLALFEGLGLWTMTDAEGRVYPFSGAATTVLDVLRRECARRGVLERCGFEAVSLLPDDEGFTVFARDGSRERADAVVVATGGGSTLLSCLGHSTVPFSPALCPIRTDTGPIRGLSGLRVRCRASLMQDGLEVAAETGELLFREYGVSGIPAFDLSRWVKPGQVLSLDLAPDRTYFELLADFEVRLSQVSGAVECLTGAFRRRVSEAVVRYAGDQSPAELSRAVKDFRLKVLGLAEPSLAQVTRGGADVLQFDAKTLESKLFPGLYAVGEALDIDGRCGGYNLHWAFASGTVAGENAAVGGEKI